MNAKKAKRLSQKALDKLFMPNIKKVANNGYFSCRDTLYCHSEESLEIIKNHYESKGYGVEITEKEEQGIFSHNARITIKW